MKALVVVPARNEEACIGDVVRSVVDAGYPCVVVDDESSDDTAHVAEAAGGIVIRLPINLGVGGALRTGWRYAVSRGYDTIVQIDGDGQHSAEYIELLLSELSRRDLDMVIGSRFAEGGSYEKMSFARRSASRTLARALRRSANVTLTDPTSGLRAITGPLLRAFSVEFPHHYLGDTFEATLVAGRRHYRIGEIPVAMRPRQGGEPSASFAASVKAMVRALTIVIIGTSVDIPERPRDPADALDVSAA